MIARKTDNRSRKDISIEHSVVDGFLDVVSLNGCNRFQIRYGSGDSQNLVVSSGGQAHFGYRDSHQFVFDLSKHAMLSQFAAVHLCVGVGIAPFKSLRLNGPGLFHLCPYLSAARARWAAGQLVERNRGHFNVNVDAIEQRATNPRHVAFDLGRSAIASATRIRAIPTRLIPISIGLQVCSIFSHALSLRQLNESGNCGKTVFL